MELMHTVRQHLRDPVDGRYGYHFFTFDAPFDNFLRNAFNGVLRPRFLDHPAVRHVRHCRFELGIVARRQIRGQLFIKIGFLPTRQGNAGHVHTKTELLLHELYGLPASYCGHLLVSQVWYRSLKMFLLRPLVRARRLLGEVSDFI